MKPWQHGVALDRLVRLAELFRAFDVGIAVGPFVAVNKRTIAEWAGAGQLSTLEDDERIDAAMVVRTSTSRTRLTDFTDARLPTFDGAPHVVRVAWSSARGRAWVVEQLGSLLALRPTIELFQEHGAHRRLADELALRLLSVRIPTSAELVGVYVAADDPRPCELSALDRVGIAPLSLPAFDVTQLARLVDELTHWQPHYSNYNRGGTWSALALIGFGGHDDEIEKPSEMSRSWRQQHTETRLLARTPLGRAMALHVDPIVAQLGSRTQRVRLMRLDPNGGRLDRHNDIGDPEAGTRDGELMRIHVPVLTNDRVVFDSWDVDGTLSHVHMAAGRAWYLDTRKPHAAGNAGDTPRVHLVVDVHADERLRALVDVSGAA